jgi:hypothetical protein
MAEAKEGSRDGSGTQPLQTLQGLDAQTPPGRLPGVPGATQQFEASTDDRMHLDEHGDAAVLQQSDTPSPLQLPDEVDMDAQVPRRRRAAASRR